MAVLDRASGPNTYVARQLRALVPFGIWAAYGLMFAGHVLFRSVGDEVLPWRSPERADRLLTGTVPPLWVQEHLRAGDLLLLDRAATGAHLLWFAFPIVAGIAITAFRRDLLVRYLIWLTVAWYACDALFLLLPTIPPWMADEPTTRILFSRGWIEYVEYDSNPVAAFPSLHAAVPAVVGAFLWVYQPRRRGWALCAWGFAAFVGFAVIYLGEHWLVDVLAGYAVAAAIAFGLTRSSVASATARLDAWHTDIRPHGVQEE